MADPITAGLIIGGTALQATSQIQAGKAEEKLRKQNAAIVLAESERKARARGELAGEKRAEGDRRQARRNVQFAKTGLGGLGTGTQRLVNEASLRRVELQADRLQEQGLFEREAGVSRASLELRKGSAARRAGKLAAGTSLLTGLATVAFLRGPSPKTTKFRNTKAGAQNPFA